VDYNGEEDEFGNKKSKDFSSLSYKFFKKLQYDSIKQNLEK
jgi:hypothetical protein